MTKRLQTIGNSAGLIIDEPILELLRITPETELDVSTDGDRLIITPIRPTPDRQRKFKKTQARTLQAHERTSFACSRSDLARTSVSHGRRSA